MKTRCSPYFKPLALAAALIMTSSVHGAETTDKSSVKNPWAFDVNVYGWLPSVDGDFSAGRFNKSKDINFINIMEKQRNFPMAFNGHFDAYWEGAYRVPAMVRWPNHIKPNTVSNDIVSHLDWAPTLLAAAGVPDVKEQLLKGYKAGNKTYKVHLDGYNQLPYLTGQAPKSAREEFFYFSDDGDLQALRYDNWKVVFAQQRAAGTMLVWGEPLVKTRIPWLYNLRTDPYEKATITSNSYWDWYFDHVFLLVPAQQYVGKFLSTFKEFPPSGKAASFSIDQVLESLQTPPNK